VIAVSRRAPSGGKMVSESLRWINAMNDLGSDRSATVLISCGPLALAVEWAAQLSQLERCVAFSSTSVHSRDSAEVQSLRLAEEALHDQCRRAGSALCLLRPTLIYGCGMDRNVSLLAAFGRRTGWIPISSCARGLRQPVHAQDLAMAALRALEQEVPLELEGELCGGSTLAYRDLAGAIAASEGVGARVVTLNPAVFRTLLRVAACLPAGRGLRTDMVDRQSINLVFDDRATRRRLGVAPRPFLPHAEDFRVPPAAEALQLPVSSGGGT
jgi:nucleoside-diphosphate-sugar epimerase